MKLYTKFVTQISIGLIVALLTTLSFGLVAFSQTPTGLVNRNANLRGGPGTNFAIVGQATQGQVVTILSHNEGGSWLQVGAGQWIAAFLVTVETGAALPDVVIPPTTGATANRAANLRAGPGTDYALIGSVRANQPLVIAGKNGDGAWLQLADGAWIAAFLVNQAGSAPAVATLSAPITPATPSAAPLPVIGENRFVLLQKRLWDVIENGGTLDGPSVHCGLERKLMVNVLDANGNRLNGVAVQVQYGARETYITGSQGKGDGVAEFVLGGGQDVKVIRNGDGSPANSDVATGLSTNPQNIPFDTLLSAQYCQDEATCKNFAETGGCNGHFSWSVTFRRQP